MLINSQLRQDQWDAVMAYDQPVIEYAISMAATMCTMILRQGLEAGFGTNMPMDDSRNSTLLLPSAGASRQEELLSAMARLRIMMTRSFISFLEELPVADSLDILILSPYDSEEIRAQMDRLRRLGNSVHLLVLPAEEVTPDA